MIDAAVNVSELNYCCTCVSGVLKYTGGYCSRCIKTSAQACRCDKNGCFSRCIKRAPRQVCPVGDEVGVCQVGYKHRCARSVLKQV